jgi:endonuclease/exonuclease/phosphatase family metal-dependent hydrolase
MLLLCFVPRRLGTIFLCLITLISACQKKSKITIEGNLPTQKQELESIALSKKEFLKIEPLRKSDTESLRFVSYNLRNWLRMEKRKNAQNNITSQYITKSDKAKAAVIKVICEANPEILGITEIGTEEDLAELQLMLKTSNIDLPYIHYVGGADKTRHVALLSKFPIIEKSSLKNIDYQINGKSFQMQRGILDATIEVSPQDNWRFIGVHLKSKREIENGDQAQMRLHEAQLLRQYLNEIFKADPHISLVCYGDFNDTKNTNTVKIVKGNYRSQGAMTPISLRDSRANSWTHYWAQEDIYSRIDYILVSSQLKNRVDRKKSRIIDIDFWNEASDHRALLGVFH